MSTDIEFPSFPQTAASVLSPEMGKVTKKASTASAIKLLPEFIRAATWGRREESIELSQQLALALEEHHPAVAKKLRSFGAMAPKQLKQCPDNLVAVEHPRHGLSQVVLSPSALAACKGVLQENRMAAELAKFNLHPRHRVLLWGPPGNGKTMLAEALASELELPFLRVKYGGLVDSHLGESAKNINRLLEYASQAPCVLFADEFDGLGGDRERAGDVGEARRITNQLLIELERLPAHCLFIAATNMTSLLDGALKRRFDFEMELKAPTLDMVRVCVERELRQELTPGYDLSQFVPAVAAMPFENVFRCVELCKRLRRDLALNGGAGIEALIAAERSLKA